MAKGFPYFKFIATDWLTGDIVFESLEVQGLFINICALYWQRNGDLSIIDIKKRYKNDKEIQILLDGNFIELDTEEKINIKFLTEQLIDAGHISQKRSENGKKGAEAKAKQMLSKSLAKSSKGLAKSSKEEEEENKNKNKSKEEENKIKEIEYIWSFNDCFGKNFTLTNARKKEIAKIIDAGFTVEDAKAVFFLKNEQWKNKPDMRQYLTPDTLLRFSNFEKYVDEVRNVNINDLKQMNGTIKPNGKMSVFDPAFNEDINNWLKETYGDGTNEI